MTREPFGIGTLIATMLPYSIFFFIFWTALFFPLGVPSRHAGRAGFANLLHLAGLNVP